MSNITASTDMTQCTAEEMPKYLDLFCQNVAETVNGQLDFQTNFNCVFLSATFTTANVNQVVPHTLGKKPAGYLVIGASAATSVYNGSKANTDQTLNLMASTPATVGLLVF